MSTKISKTDFLKALFDLDVKEVEDILINILEPSNNEVRQVLFQQNASPDYNQCNLSRLLLCNMDKRAIKTNQITTTKGNILQITGYILQAIKKIYNCMGTYEDKKNDIYEWLESIFINMQNVSEYKITGDDINLFIDNINLFEFEDLDDNKKINFLSCFAKQLESEQKIRYIELLASTNIIDRSNTQFLVDFIKKIANNDKLIGDIDNGKLKESEYIAKWILNNLQCQIAIDLSKGFDCVQCSNQNKNGKIFVPKRIVTIIQQHLISNNHQKKK
eukprot:288736_1